MHCYSVFKVFGFGKVFKGNLMQNCCFCGVVFRYVKDSLIVVTETLGKSHQKNWKLSNRWKLLICDVVKFSFKNICMTLMLHYFICA